MSPLVVKTRVAIGTADLDDIAPAERAEAERLGLGQHRRAEWRAGRLAAHAALAAVLGEATAARLCVLSADDGAPLVGGADVALSLSHGKRFAVAAAGHVARLGIDLCEVARTPNVQRIAERFLHASERALPRSPADWALLWAMKEAAAKAVRRGLFDGGLAASRVVSLERPSFAFPELIVEVELGADDVVAVVYDDPAPPRA